MQVSKIVAKVFMWGWVVVTGGCCPTEDSIYHVRNFPADVQWRETDLYRDNHAKLLDRILKPAAWDDPAERQVLDKVYVIEPHAAAFRGYLIWQGQYESQSYELYAWGAERPLLRRDLQKPSVKNSTPLDHIGVLLVRYDLRTHERKAIAERLYPSDPSEGSRMLRPIPDIPGVDDLGNTIDVERLDKAFVDEGSLVFRLRVFREGISERIPLAIARGPAEDAE